MKTAINSAKLPLMLRKAVAELQVAEGTKIKYVFLVAPWRLRLSTFAMSESKPPSVPTEPASLGDKCVTKATKHVNILGPSLLNESSVS